MLNLNIIFKTISNTIHKKIHETYTLTYKFVSNIQKQILPKAQHSKL